MTVEDQFPEGSCPQEPLEGVHGPSKFTWVVSWTPQLVILKECTA
jgi:hypothetical protein